MKYIFPSLFLRFPHWGRLIALMPLNSLLPFARHESCIIKNKLIQVQTEENPDFTFTFT